MSGQTVKTMSEGALKRDYSTRKIARARLRRLKRRYGRPKTDEERKKTHFAIYGDKKLPPRGSGLRRG